jgi:GTP cyclohydrolase II
MKIELCGRFLGISNQSLTRKIRERDDEKKNKAKMTVMEQMLYRFHVRTVSLLTLTPKPIRVLTECLIFGIILVRLISSHNKKDAL